MNIIARIIFVFLFSASLTLGAEENSSISISDDKISISSPPLTFIRAKGLNGVFIMNVEVSNELFHFFLKDVHKNKDDFIVANNITTNSDYKLTIHSKDGFWKNNNYPANYGKYPVSFITIDEAVTFCDWLTAKFPNLGLFRLPFRSEWACIAYGVNVNRNYPWGNALTGRHLDALKSLGDVYSHKILNTSDGIMNLWGNVSEFIVSDINPKIETPQFIINPSWAGTSFMKPPAMPDAKRIYWGFWHNLNSRSTAVGFRVLLDTSDNAHSKKINVLKVIGTVDNSPLSKSEILRYTKKINEINEKIQRRERLMQKSCTEESEGETPAKK